MTLNCNMNQFNKIIINQKPKKMKKTTKIFVSTFAIAIAAISITEFSAPAHGNQTGAPAGRTGSPGDGTNCTVGCHSGTPSTQAGVIVVGTPPDGYVPGQTYNMGASISGIGIQKFGFQISPQNAAGTQLGTMAVPAAAVNLIQLVGAGKYMTHKTQGTVFPGGTAGWAFEWTAPAAGSGPVTFYGAFNLTNSSGTTAGDQIILSSTTIQENTSASIGSIDANSAKVTLCPNPATDCFYLKNDLSASQEINITIIDITGKVVKRIENSTATTVDVSDIAKGYYVVRIETDKGVAIKKLIKE